MQDGDASRSNRADGLGDRDKDICLPKLKRKLPLDYREKFPLGNWKFPYEEKKSGAKLYCLAPSHVVTRT